MDIKPQEQRAMIVTSGPLDTLMAHMLDHNDLPEMLVRRVMGEMAQYRIRPEGARSLVKSLSFMSRRAVEIIKYMEEHFRDDYCYAPNIVEDVGDGRPGLSLMVRSKQPFDGERVLPYFTIVASAFYPMPGADLNAVLPEPKPNGLVGWTPTSGGQRELGLSQEILDAGSLLVGKGAIEGPTQVECYDDFPQAEMIGKRYAYLLSDEDILICINETLLFSTQHAMARVDDTVERAEVVSLR